MTANELRSEGDAARAAVLTRRLDALRQQRAEALERIDARDTFIAGLAANLAQKRQGREVLVAELGKIEARLAEIDAELAGGGGTAT